MDEALALPEPKISLIEFLYIGIALAIVSVINLIPLAGDVTSIVAGGLMFFYLYQKGLWGTSTIATNAVGYACGFVPFLQWIPTALAAWVATFIIDHNPKLEAVTEKAGQLEAFAEGGAGAGGPEGAAAVEGGAAAAGGTEATATATAAETAETTVNEAGGVGVSERTGAAGAEAPETAEAARGGGTAVVEGGPVEAEAPEGEGLPREEVPPEVLGERPEPMEETQRELFEETPREAAGAPEETEEEAPASRETEAELKAQAAEERKEEFAEKLKRIRPQEEEQREGDAEQDQGTGEEEGGDEAGEEPTEEDT